MSKMASGDSIETIEVVEPTSNINSAKMHSIVNESSTEDDGKWIPCFFSPYINHVFDKN